MELPIADLHSDLLWYLSLDKTRTPYDLNSGCSIPQLKQGKVAIQTLAIFTETSEPSIESAKKQAEIFKNLPRLYPDVFQFIHNKEQLEIENSDKIGIVAAVENASSISNEYEAISISLERLNSLQKMTGKLLYVSLTWNSENRFGGGVLTKTGLKNDGKVLLEYLDAKKIGVDFSHASDYLAFDILNHIEKKGLSLPILASHSNLRSITYTPRNLTDEIAKEIIKKKGVIGINFIRNFLGQDSPNYISKHIEHLLKIGGEEALCFGADFFFWEDAPISIRKPLEDVFFPSYQNASAYTKVITLLKHQLNLSEKCLKNLCHENYISFLKKVMP